MERLFTNIIGTPVVDDDFKHPITTVKDVVIDPETGKLIALIVNINKNLVIAPIDILAWGEAVRIPTHDSIVSGDEIFRVMEVQKKHIHILRSSVETKKKEFIGNVTDFAIDGSDLTLKKIYTSKGLLGLIRYDSRIIPAKNIEKILPNKIIVKDNAQTVYEKSRAVIEELAAG